MALPARLLRPIVSGDPDARRYIEAVQRADGNTLEPGVRKAITDFVVGCKADGIWSAIKASCILMGARTLSGALTPLVGAAPTNNNFVSGDYNRKTGLIGDGSTKYLNTNRNNNADPQNNKHIALYSSAASEEGTSSILLGCGTGSSAGRTAWVRQRANNAFLQFFRLNCGTANFTGNGTEIGFLGMSRSLSASFVARLSGSSQTFTQASESPLNLNLGVFANEAGGAPSSDRIAYYSIGEHIDLQNLDSRVSTLYTAIGNAIP